MLPIGEFRQRRSGPLMLLFANSLDGVRGCLVSGFRRHERPGGHSPCGTDTAHSRRASQFERRTTWGQPPPAVRRSEALLAVQRSCPPLKKTRWRTGVPARPGSSAGVPPNSSPATPNHVEADASGRRIVSEPPSAARHSRRSRFKSTENPA